MLKFDLWTYCLYIGISILIVNNGIMVCIYIVGQMVVKWTRVWEIDGEEDVAVVDKHRSYNEKIIYRMWTFKYHQQQK